MSKGDIENTNTNQDMTAFKLSRLDLETIQLEDCNETK